MTSALISLRSLTRKVILLSLKKEVGYIMAMLYGNTILVTKNYYSLKSKEWISSPSLLYVSIKLSGEEHGFINSCLSVG